MNFGASFFYQHSLFDSSFEIDTSMGPFAIRSFHENPIMAKIILEVIVQETNAYFKMRDDKESKDAIDYISRELPKIQIVDIQETLSSVLSVKLELWSFQTLRPIMFWNILIRMYQSRQASLQKGFTYILESY